MDGWKEIWIHCALKGEWLNDSLMWINIQPVFLSKHASFVI